MLFPVNFNDIDYCLKLQEQQLRVVVDPDTVLYHYESSTRPPDVSEWEIRLLQARHGSAVPGPTTTRASSRRRSTTSLRCTLADDGLLR